MTAREGVDMQVLRTTTNSTWGLLTLASILGSSYAKNCDSDWQEASYCLQVCNVFGGVMLCIVEGNAMLEGWSAKYRVPKFMKKGEGGVASKAGNLGRRCVPRSR